MICVLSKRRGVVVQYGNAQQLVFEYLRREEEGRNGHSGQWASGHGIFVSASAFFISVYCIGIPTTTGQGTKYVYR